VLDQGSLDTEVLNRALGVIKRNARAQVQIIEDILDISRIIAGKLSLELREADLVPIIRTAVETVQPMADNRGVAISVSLDAPSKTALVDPFRMQQVLWNLLSNGIKFTPGGGLVEISLEQSNSEIRIVVRDTGEGISPEFLPHIFERFRQKDSSYARKYSGLGLGLAIVRHVVDLHKGVVEAQSEGEGKGATFSVRLPLPSGASNVPAERQSVKSAKAPARLAGKRILVVEDDEDSREMMKAIVGTQGAEVKLAGTSAEGLRLLEEWNPDLIVSDIGMPGEDGYDLIRKVRAQERTGRKLPAIALTGYAGEQSGQQALAAGFHIYLQKPIEPESVVRAIEMLLASS
jgi:CheY-like chemotaxis protein